MRNLLAMLAITTILSTPIFAAEEASKNDSEAETSSMKCCKMNEEKKVAMQEKMQNMQALMAAIREEQDSEKRRQLMQEHMASMREGMNMMKQDVADSSSESIEERVTMMENQIGIMRMMMEQVIENSAQLLD